MTDNNFTPQEWFFAITRSVLRPYGRLVLMTMGAHMEHELVCRASLAQLALESGLSESEVGKQIVLAEEAGWIERDGDSFYPRIGK